MTQDLLLEQIWGGEYVGESHMLQVNVNRLRRKIEPDPAHPRYILTKVGIGYQLASAANTLPTISKRTLQTASRRFAVVGCTYLDLSNFGLSSC